MSVPMQPDDPAYHLLLDDVTTTPVVYRPGCFICEDPEFAQMGLPLCQLCPACTKANNNVKSGHIPADDETCDDCGNSLRAHYQNLEQSRHDQPETPPF